MDNPHAWLLIVEYQDGTKGCVNLWQAVEQGRLSLRVNPLNTYRVVDLCADVPENRAGYIDVLARIQPTWAVQWNVDGGGDPEGVKFIDADTMIEAMDKAVLEIKAAFPNVDPRHIFVRAERARTSTDHRNKPGGL